VSDATALNHPNHNHNDRENQKEMDKPSHGIRRDKTKKPEDDEDDGNCSKHVSSPFNIEVSARRSSETFGTRPGFSGSDGKAALTQSAGRAVALSLLSVFQLSCQPKVNCENILRY